MSAQNNVINKKPFFQNISNIVQKGSAAVKEKISTLFKKKVKLQSDVIPLTIQQGPGGDKVLMPTPVEPKHIFKIEEDEDAKENIYYLNDGDSDEDEEDEYEEEENEEQKEQNENKKEENKQSIKEGEGEVEDIAEKIKVNQNKDNSIPNSNTSTNTDSDLNSEVSYDIQTFAHRIYSKGSYVDITEFLTTQLMKPKKSKLLSMIGFKKNSDRNYLAFFDEHFLYFLKDNEISKEDKNLRRIGNKYNIKLLQNAIIDNEENSKVQISLEFFKDSNTPDTIIKELFFDAKQAERFVNLFNIYLQRLKISFTDEDEVDQNENHEINENVNYKREIEEEVKEIDTQKI